MKRRRRFGFLWIILLVCIIVAFYKSPYGEVLEPIKQRLTDIIFAETQAAIPTTEPTTAATTVTTQPETEPETEPTTAPTEPTEITYPDFPPEELTAKSAFVYDTATGEYRYALGNQRQRLKIASITKVFSAWVALQIMSPDTVITAGEELTWIDEESSRAWIYEGQRVTVTTCVEGMMIPSGNDAAYILAVATGRTILNDPEADARKAFDAFVAEMNAYAQKQGLTGTHFTNPDGIDEEGHYSTARDVLKMAQLAMENPIIRSAAATASMTACYTSGQTANWKNSNHLLHEDSEYYCPNTIGLKTGHTEGAGWCQISAFDEEDTTLIIGVFGSETIEDRNADTIKLYETFQ